MFDGVTTLTSTPSARTLLISLCNGGLKPIEVYFVPFDKVPEMEPEVLSKVAVLTLWALASFRNCEYESDLAFECGSSDGMTMIRIATTAMIDQIQRQFWSPPLASGFFDLLGCSCFGSWVSTGPC